MPFWRWLRRTLKPEEAVLNRITDELDRAVACLERLVLRLRKIGEELHERAEEHDEVRHLCERAREGVKKLEEIIGLLRSLTREGVPDRETLDRMYELWHEVEEIIIKHFTIIDDMAQEDWE